MTNKTVSLWLQGRDAAGVWHDIRLVDEQPEGQPLRFPGPIEMEREAFAAGYTQGRWVAKQYTSGNVNVTLTGKP